MQKNLYIHIFSIFLIFSIYSIMSKMKYIMNILNFMQRFPEEASCISYLKEQKEQSGVVCKHCGCKEHTGTL